MSFCCPKCGFRDSPCWRASHWMLYTQTCRIDELEPFEPDIAKRLREEIEFEDGPYWYKMAKSGRVYRCLKELKAEYKRGHITEKPKPYKNNGQITLQIACKTSQEQNP